MQTRRSSLAQQQGGSSLCWLMSLQRVCKHWREHIATSHLFITRCRLERFKQLCLLHDYAHHIVTARASSRKERLEAVPCWIALSFEDGSRTWFSVPRGGSCSSSSSSNSEQQGTVIGLPSHALMLSTPFNQLTEVAFTSLLSDLDVLDKRHAASMVLKISNSSSSSSSNQSVQQQQQQQQQEQGNQPAPSATAAAAAAATAANAAAATCPAAGKQSTSPRCAFSSMEQLIAAAAPLLCNDGPLPDVVLEGSATSPYVYFIPTKHGFCRRLPRMQLPQAAVA